MVDSQLEEARPGLLRPAVLTGGSGRLGRELQALLPGIMAPTSEGLDIAAPDGYLKQTQPKLIVHAAAYTDVTKAETDRSACWRLNVDGTRNMARAAARLGARFVLISTDYIFSGNEGDYKETDIPGPVRNYYALTKLVAEEVARSILPPEQLLIIRTSFRAREWPHPVAFDDLFTSQDYVDKIAPNIALAIARVQDIPFDTLHIAGQRRSALELARERTQAVQAASRSSAPVELPADISLNTERWQAMIAGWQ